MKHTVSVDWFDQNEIPEEYHEQMIMEGVSRANERIAQGDIEGELCFEIETDKNKTFSSGGWWRLDKEK